MKKILLFLILLSTVSFGQISKSVFTQAQKDTIKKIAGDSSQVAETRAKNYTDTQFNNNPKGWQTASQVRSIVGDSTAVLRQQIGSGGGVDTATVKSLVPQALTELQYIATPTDNNYIPVETGTGVKKTTIYNIPQESRIQQLQSLITQLQNRITLLEQALGDTTAPTVQIPNAPSNILASSTEKSITISWQDNSTNETGFEVSRKVSALENWAVLDTLSPNIITYIDSLAQQGTTYDYRVRALGTTGNSGYITYFGASLIQVNYALRVNPVSFYVEADSTGGGGVSGSQWVFNAENNNFTDFNGTAVFGDSINFDITNVNPLNGVYSYRLIGESPAGGGTQEYQRFNQTFNDSFYIQFRLRIDTLTLKQYTTLTLISFLNANYTIGSFGIVRWLAGSGNPTRFSYTNQYSEFGSNGYALGDTVTITLFYYEGSPSDSMQTFKMWYRNTLVVNTTIKGSYGWGQISNFRIGSVISGNTLKSHLLIDNIIISTTDPRLSASGGNVYASVPIYLVNQSDSTLSLQTFSISPSNIFYTDSAQVASLPVNILPGDSLARTIKVLRSGVNGGSYSATLSFATQKLSQTYNLLGFIKTPNVIPPDTTTPPTSGNIWYLSVTGSGTQDGKSRANARLYTNHSTLNILPGDTVYFIEGVYTQQLVWQKSGSLAGLVTLMPDPQNTGEAVFSNPIDYAINISGRSYLKLYKLTFRNSNRGILVGQGKVKFLDSLHISKNAGTGINIYGNNGGSYNPNYDPGINSGVDSVFIRWCYVATDTQVNTQTDCITIYWAHGVRIIGNYLLQGNYTGDGHNDNIQTGHGLGDVYIANNMLINLKQSNSQIFMNGNSWKGYKTVIYNNVSIHYGAGVGIWQTYAYNGFNPNGGISPGDGEVYLINNTLVGKRYPFMMTTLSDSAHLPQRLDSLYAVNNLIYNIQSDGSATFGLPKKTTDTIYAMYLDNNIHAIPSGTSWAHTESWYGNIPQGKATLSNWASSSTLKMLNSTAQLPTFRNFQYNSALYDQEDLRLTQNSIGVGAGRADIKIKGNQWANLKTLIESFGLEWTEFKNPYVSWATGSARSELSPNIGACSVVP